MPLTESIYEQFTFAGFLDWSENSEPGKAFALARSRSRRGECCSLEPSQVWNGNVTYQEALDMAHNGWADGLRHLEALTINGAPRSALKKPRLEYAVAGARPSISHYLAGDPAHMQTWTPRSSAHRPVLNLLICAAISCKVGSNAYLLRGAAICSFIDSVEDAGISASVTLRYNNRSEFCSLTACQEIEIKTAGQPLDRDRTIFAISHAAFYRRMIFRYLEQDRFSEDFSGCYAYPEQTSPPPRPDTMIIPPLVDDDSRPVSEIAADLMRLYETHITRET